LQKQNRNGLSRKSMTRLSQCHAVVIGTGAIGRNVAILLASVGIRHLSLYDQHNICQRDVTSGFLDFDVGSPAVDAVANIAHQYQPQMELLTYPIAFHRTHLATWDQGLSSAVFLCDSSTKMKKTYWKWLADTAHFISDGCIAGDKLRVRCAEPPVHSRGYSVGHSGAERSESGRGSKDVVTASLVASLMVSQFTRWLNGMKCIRELQFSRKSCELIFRN
jgi:sulfur carrier protein ThiS adenylyltransferase